MYDKRSGTRWLLQHEVDRFNGTNYQLSSFAISAIFVCIGVGTNTKPIRRQWTPPFSPWYRMSSFVARSTPSVLLVWFRNKPLHSLLLAVRIHRYSRFGHHLLCVRPWRGLRASCFLSLGIIGWPILYDIWNIDHKSSWRLSSRFSR